MRLGENHRHARPRFAGGRGGGGGGREGGLRSGCDGTSVGRGRLCDRCDPSGRGRGDGFWWYL